MELVQPGKIIIYYGKGQGKTTAGLGRAIRFAGNRKKVIILQFMKGRESGEYKFFKKIQDKKIFPIEIYLVGPKIFLTKETHPSLKHFKKAKQGLDLAKKILSQKKCNLLILDEILYAQKFGLIKEKEILDLLKNRGKIHIILTGADTISKNLRKKANQISKITEIKHYFSKEERSTKGLEY